MSPNFFKRGIQRDKFLSLDIGSEAVKALIFKRELKNKKKDEFLSAEKSFKSVILGYSTQYFEKCGIFNSNDFEKDVLKNAILKAVQGAYQNFVFLSKTENKKKIEQDWTKWPVVMSLPPNVLRGRIFLTDFLRKKPSHSKISKLEEKNIYEEAFRETRRKISLKFREEYGILPAEIHWTALRIIQTKIDGYSVAGFSGYEGKNLRIKILTVFLPKNYLKKIKSISAELGFKILKITHLAEVLPVIFDESRKEGVFIDSGGEISQFFSVRTGFLEEISEFNNGGKIFSQQIADVLGLDEEMARILKEKYSEKFLSAGTMKRIKEILRPEREVWYNSLKDKIKKIGLPRLGGVPIFLFGGGSLLPEIKEILQEKQIIGLNGSPTSQPLNISFIYPNNLDNIEDMTMSLKSPKDVPPLFITYRL